MPVRNRLVALACAAALVATACGSRLSDEELSTAAGGAAAPAQERRLEAGVTETEEGAMLGDLPVPCSEGGEEPQPVAAGTVGVTDDAIEIAVVSDKAGAVKVPTASIEESMQAFVDWCNGFGGINGRELALTKIDSKLFEHLEATRQACEAGVFAIVGSGSVQDQQGAQAMVDCGLIEFPAYTATAEKAGSDSMVTPIPNPTYQLNTGPAEWLAEQHPEAIKKAAMLSSNIETAAVQAERLVEGYEQVGFEFVYEKNSAVIEESYASYAREMKDRGVEYLMMVSAASETVKLLRDMRTQGFEPEVIDLGAQYYDPELLAEAGAEGALVQTNTVPFEDVDDSPALQAYLEAYEAVGSDIEPTALGVQSFSAGLLFAQAASNAPELSREAVLAAGKEIHEWNGGGLHYTADPGANSVGRCFNYMVIEGGEFVRRHPEDPASFDCREEAVVELEGDYGSGAKAAGGGG